MTADPSSLPPIEVEAAVDRLIATADVIANRPPVQADVRDDSILGAVLAAPIKADRDHPPFDRATMDGYAIRARDAKLALNVVATVAAGPPPPNEVADGGCVAIATGAAVPPGLDAVIEHESTDRSNPLTIHLDRVDPGRNIHPKSADARAGDTLLPAGTRIDHIARGIAVAAGAAIGGGLVMVRSRPRISIVTTGDEVRPIDDPLDRPEDAVRIRNSNGSLLASLLADRTTFGANLSPPMHAADDVQATADALDAAAATSDLVITVGGVSAGVLDLVPAHWESRGWSALIRGVRMQPGRPFSLWRSPDATTIAIGLPGNPVSAFACAQIFVRSWIRASLGLDPDPGWWRLPLLEAVRPNPQRPAFRPATLVMDASGRPAVRVPTWQGSGDLPHLAGTDGLARLNPGVDDLPAGSMVSFLSHHDVGGASMRPGDQRS
ncbi:MAG: molybdopterin molybdotransferase MoeA [Planctomycetota bacterium]|nr:molybdopterin molybdotransferase MoeA [Planctomycetota bacterium]